MGNGNFYGTSVSTGSTSFYRVSIDLDSAREAEEGEYNGFKKPWAMVSASINKGEFRWYRAYYDGFALEVYTGSGEKAIAFERGLKKNS